MYGKGIFYDMKKMLKGKKMSFKEKSNAMLYKSVLLYGCET